MGIAHGAFCIGCCWSLMLVMFGVGLGSLTLMFALGALTAVEKNVAWGRRLSRPLGIALILAARLRGRRVTRASYPRRAVDDQTAACPSRRAERRASATADTRASILGAARARLLADGYANLSTRAVAEAAGVPLSQIHYHFGSKQQLILAVLAAENVRLLERQRRMYAGPEPLWRHWEMRLRLPRGGPRVRVRPRAPGDDRRGLVGRDGGGRRPRPPGRLVRPPRRRRAREAERMGGLGPFTPEEVSMLMGLPFMGAEAAILLGMDEREFPARSALRKIGALSGTPSAAEPVVASPPHPPLDASRARHPDATGELVRDGVRIAWERFGPATPGPGQRTILLTPTWSILHSRFWKAQVAVPRAAPSRAHVGRPRQRAIRPPG